MKERKQTSYYLKPSDVTEKWHLVDADDKVLGRLATKVASIVRGKESANYTPSMDSGQFVVVVNSDKIRVTGNKEKDKKYYRHSGYPGGLKTTTLEEQRKKDSSKIILDAVRGMLPKNRLGRQLLTKVKVFQGADHNHQAQSPQEVIF